MSYCRWSSDCYLSDVYVYEADEGVRIHIASGKYISDKTRPLKPPHFSSAKNMMAYIKECEIWVKTAHTEPIGLPFDGQSFTFDTYQEAAKKLIELKNIGYMVPQFAIDSLLEEAKEESNG